MEADFFKKNKKQIVKIVVITIIILVLYRLITNLPATTAVVGKFFSIIKPFVLAGMVAYLLYFPCNYLEKKAFKKIKSRKVARFLSIAIVYLLFIAFLVLILAYLIPIVLSSIVEIIKNSPDYLESFKSFINGILGKPFFAGFKTDIITDQLDKLTTQNFQNQIVEYFNIERVLGYTSQAIEFVKSLIKLIITFVVSVYMLFERESLTIYFKKFLEARTKKKTYLKILTVFKEANDIFRRYITSQFIDAFVVGVIIIIALLILKVKYAVLLGFLIGLFNLIPFFGALTAGIVAILLTIVTGGLKQGIIAGSVILILQQLDANIIQPKIVGEHLKVSRILVLTATTLGGAYFGVWGMFFGVPVLTTIKAVIDNITDNRIKNNKIRRLINKRLLVKIRKPNKNTVKRLRIKNRIRA